MYPIAARQGGTFRERSDRVGGGGFARGFARKGRAESCDIDSIWCRRYLFIGRISTDLARLPQVLYPTGENPQEGRCKPRRYWARGG